MTQTTPATPNALRSAFTPLAFCLLLALLFFPALASAATYYVRTDGGTAAQCTGKSNAAYGGSGSNQACAWKHPYYALPPNSAARIAGGDTLIIGPGEYMVGWGAPGSADTSGRCYSGGRYDCYLPPVPSGTASTRTRILGAGHDSGCAAPPKLWGTERVRYMINLENSSNVEVGCLELTDKSDCVELHSDSTVACNRNTAPHGNWAAHGIYSSNSRNVYLHDLDIHGMANRGIMAGGLTDWTLERVKIIGNGWAGWDGDIGSGSSNSGQIIMRNVEVAWNGCGERWQTRTPWACWAQESAGYGDGLGTGRTGGQWLIEDSQFHHNTSDGLDLLYLDGAASTSVTIRRVRAEGNAGNQLKTSGTALIENSVVVGDCSYFNGRDYMRSGDQCRALGNAVSVELANGQTATLRHNTITGQGDCLILTSGGSSASRAVIQNNALIGALDWRSNLQGNTGELACGHYADKSAAAVSFSGNLFWNVKSGQCPSGSICQNPSLTNSSLGSTFNALPLAGSPLVDAVAVLADVTTDFFRNARPYGARADIGAVERGATSSVSGGRATGGVLPPLLSTGGTTSASPAQQVSPGQASLVATTATVATPTAGSTTVRPSVARRMLHGLRSLIQRDNVRAYTARLATGLRQMALLPSRMMTSLLADEEASPSRATASGNASHGSGDGWIDLAVNAIRNTLDSRDAEAPESPAIGDDTDTRQASDREAAYPRVAANERVRAVR